MLKPLATAGIGLSQLKTLGAVNHEMTISATINTKPYAAQRLRAALFNNDLDPKL